MVIFIRELVRNRKSFLIWTISLIALNGLMMMMFPTLAEQAEGFDEMLKSYPQGFIEAFGLDRLSMGNILHYFGLESYLFVTLFGGMYAMILGSSILSKEESDKTIEFLLAKPVTRNTIVTSKVLCGLFYIFLLNLVFSLTNFIMFEMVKPEDYSMKIFVLLSIAPFLLQVLFASIGLLASVFIVKTKAIMPLSIGVVLGAYFISIASSLSEKLSSLKYFTPFRYFDAADLIHDEAISGLYLFITFSVMIITVGLTYLFYNKKNITV